MTEKERTAAFEDAMVEIEKHCPAGLTLADIRAGLPADLRAQANDAFLGLDHAWLDARQTQTDERFRFALEGFKRAWVKVGEFFKEPALPGMNK